MMALFGGVDDAKHRGDTRSHQSRSSSGFGDGTRRRRCLCTSGVFLWLNKRSQSNRRVDVSLKAHEHHCQKTKGAVLAPQKRRATLSPTDPEGVEGLPRMFSLSVCPIPPKSHSPLLQPPPAAPPMPLPVPSPPACCLNPCLLDLLLLPHNVCTAPEAWMRSKCEL